MKQITRFYYEPNADDKRMLKIIRYVKKMSRYGVFMEVEENFDRTNVVKLYAPKLHTDMLGNTAIRP